MSTENTATTDTTATDTTATNPDGTGAEKVYSEKAFKELISQRDTLKKNQSELQVQFDQLKAKLDKAGEDELKKKGDLQTLLDNKEKEIAETKKALEEISQYKTKYEDLDKSIRENLLKQLPDEMQEVAEELSTVKLQKFVELNKTTTAGMDNGKAGKGKIKIDGKKWNDFSSADLSIIRASDFTGYSQLYKEKFGMNPTS